VDVLFTSKRTHKPALFHQDIRHAHSLRPRDGRTAKSCGATSLPVNIIV